MAADWFRRQCWSEEDQTDFWQRLAKARDHNRAQYVFIQGLTLMGAGPQYRIDAISLFDHVIDRYSDSLNFVQALSAKADCLLDSGDIDAALTYYDLAIQQMRLEPRVQTWAWLDFAWLVATKGLSNRYETALGLLDEFGNEQQLFPIVVFRLYGSRALIQSAIGLTDAAAAAQTALNAADKEISGLRHHPKIGLVGERYSDLCTRLTTIAQAR